MMKSILGLLVLCLSLSIAFAAIPFLPNPIPVGPRPVNPGPVFVPSPFPVPVPVFNPLPPVGPRPVTPGPVFVPSPFPGTGPVWSPSPPVGWTPSPTPGVTPIWSPNPPRGWVPPAGSIPHGFSSYGYNVNPFFFNGRQLTFGALPSQLGNNNIPWTRYTFRGILPDGNYAFRSPVNNLLLEVPAWNAYENAQVFLDNYYAQPNQIWYITRVYPDQQVYLVVSRSSNLVLALNNGQVVQQTYTGVATQYWRITEQDPERYQLENLSTGEAIKSGDKNGFGQENYAFQAATVTKPFASGRVDRQFYVEIPV